MAPRSREVDPTEAVEHTIDALDTSRGMLLSSSYEYPGRYTMWDRAFVNPPVLLWSKKKQFFVKALNGRGNVLLMVGDVNAPSFTLK
jgi:anthranilate synthase